MCGRLGEKAIDRGITWKLLVSVGCLSVLSRIFWCVVSWFKSSQTCDATCAQASCDFVHGPFKRKQKKNLIAGRDPKAEHNSWNCKHLRDFNPQTRATNVEPLSGSQQQNLWLKASAYVAMGTVWRQERCTKQVQSYDTTSTYLHLSEKLIMATWNIITQTNLQEKYHTKRSIGCSKQRRCGGRVVWYFKNDHSSKNLK